LNGEIRQNNSYSLKLLIRSVVHSTVKQNNAIKVEAQQEYKMWVYLIKKKGDLKILFMQV